MAPPMEHSLATALPSPLPPIPPMNPYRLAQVVRRPGEFMRWAVGRCGDPFRLEGFIGRMVLTGNPEGIRAIFTADPDLFEPPDDDLLEPFVGPGSLLLISGARHKAERKLLMPPFHGARMRAYGEVIRETAIRLAADLPVGRPFTVQELAQGISLEVIIRAVFGVVDPGQVQLFREATVEMVEAMSPWVVFFKSIRRPFAGLGPWSRFVRARERLSRLLYEEIDRREAAPAEREDILSLMLSARYEDGSRMSREQVRDELVTLLFAGHETTAISITWACYQLHRHEAVRKRLMAELEAAGPHADPETLARLPYLDAVCNEILRLHPVVPLVPRRLKGPFTLHGYQLEAGTGVAACISLVHMNPEIYPEPGVFRPERFLERTYTPFEFLPFGGGSRRCLGAAFAVYEMKLVLAALLPRYELELESDKPVHSLRRNITVGPDRKVRMRITRRLEAVPAGL